jgi:hypothetical protein
LLFSKSCCFKVYKDCPSRNFRIGNSDTINFGDDTLRPFTTIEGRIDTSGAGAGERYAQIRGLECLERVSPDGSFVLHGLPPGDLSIRITSASERPWTREVSHIRTTPGDTARMELSGAWTYAKRIYFNTTKSGADIGTNQYNFPVLLRFDSTTFNFTTALSNGEDIRFIKENGTTLPFEIEEWSQTTNKGAVWVQIDTIFANSSNQYILMTWGEQGISSASNSTAVFDTAKGFVGVWHLGETATGATGELHDATANHLDGQGGGGALDSLPARTPGLCGMAQEFNGHSSYIRIRDTTALHLNSSFTVSFWVYYDKKSSDNQRFISKDGDWSVKEYANRPQFTFEDSAYLVADTVLSQNCWNFVTVAAQRLDSAATATIYINGRETGVYENTLPSFVPGTRAMDDHLYFGQQGNGAFFLYGILDEIRIQRTALSADEIKLQYESQKPGGKLILLGQ